MKKLKTIFKKAHLALAVTLFGAGLVVAQPVIKVPPNCIVVVAGTGVGAFTGPGAQVGNGGIVCMPDPFDFPASSNGEFNYVANGTTLSGWNLRGDISIQTATINNAAIQSAGAVTPQNIQSYNKILRFAENANPSLARSKGRVTVSYVSGVCGSSITFEIFKSYSSPLPNIVGPDCLLPNTTYTYSVDQIASDNATDAIGFDSYYWSGLPAGAINVYNSADNSSITFTTGATITTGNIKCCFGRCNPFDGDASSIHTSCVSKLINPQPLAPVYSTPPPTCLNTGLTSFTVVYPTPILPITYTWTAPGTIWTLVTTTVGATQTLTVTGLDNNPGSLQLIINNGACLPTTINYPINRNFVSPSIAITGPTCVSPGTYGYSLPSNALLNPTTVSAIPLGWTVTPTNGTGSTFNITIPIGTVGGIYNMKVYSTICSSVFVTLTINVKPATPVISNSSPTPNCVVRGLTPTINTISCALVTGATSYTWTLPTGWSCINCTTNNPTFTPNGTTAGPVSLTVTANGANSCISNPSAAFTINYKPVIPIGITSACMSSGSITGTVSVTNAQNFGSYSVTSLPAGITGSNATGVNIPLTIPSSLAPGVYNLFIAHTTTSCGSATNAVGFPVTIAANIAGSTTIALNPSNPCDQYAVNFLPVGSTYVWKINGATPSGPNFSIFGNGITLCGTTAPTSVCVDVTVGGCTTRVCSASIGTHGLRPTISNNSDTILDNVKIYPNPNKGNFVIKVTDFNSTATATIVDIAGKEIATYNLKKGENKIQNEGLAQGTFIVMLSIDGKTESRQIIIN